MRHVFVSFFVLLVIGFYSSNLWACSCAQVSIEEEFESAKFVFTGKVIEAQHVDPNEGPIADPGKVFNDYVVKVDKIYKGYLPTFVSFRITPWGNLCGITLNKGREYLLWAYPKEGYIETNLCTRTKPKSAAAEDIEWLETPK